MTDGCVAISATDAYDYDYKACSRIRKDVWNLSAEMADRPELYWSTALGGYWVLASAAAYEAVARDTDLFSTRITSIPPTATQPMLIPTTLDPPLHGVYRKQMTQRLFSVRALQGLDEAARRSCAALIDEFVAMGHCEFVETFASRLPVDLFLSMMGAAVERRDAFLSWVNKIFRAKDAAELDEGRAEANAFIAGWLDEQSLPLAAHGPMFRAMQEIEVDGRARTREEMHSMTMMLFLGGLDTVTSQLSHIFCFLAESACHRRYLVDYPERVAAAVEELLRRFGIANSTRVVTRDASFMGAALKEGQMVLLSTAFANLDRRRFADPLAVDFERDERVRHLGFGAGPHMCIGAHLARTLLRESLVQLLPRMPGLHIASGAELIVTSGGTFRLMALPLVWDAAAA